MVARDAGTILFSAEVFADAADLEADEAREKARSDAGVKALLLESFPIRFWDPPTFAVIELGAKPPAR